MQPVALLAISVLASVGVSYAVVSLAVPKPAEAPGDPELAQQLAALVSKVEDQQRTIDQMSKRALTAEAPMRSNVPGISEAQVEAALLSWLDKHAGDAAPGTLADAAAKIAKGTKAAAAPADANGLYAELMRVGGDYAKISDIWKRAKEAGQIDALVALYEQNAKDNPNVANAHVALGAAYLQKLFHGTMGPEAGIWGTKADKAFDQALDLDPTHWSARFQKAVSLSNWPDFLGRKKDAIDNFETLIQQQESAGNTQPEGWNTYLMLGNLYSQQGKDDKAKDIWQRGARAFPDNQPLKDKVTAKN